MTLPPFQKRQSAFQHKFLEVWCLLVIDERLLVLVLFVQQKFIRIAVRTIDDKFQVSRLLPGRDGKLVVMAAPKVPYGRVIEVMAAAHEAGVEQVGIASDRL